MTEGGAALDHFARIVGARYVLADPADRAAYEADGRSPRGRALVVLSPASTAEVSALVRSADALGVTLVPQGARTGLVGAGLPSDDGLRAVLSLDRLNRPPVIDPVNRRPDADAGVLLSTLNAAAAPHDLSFPIDLGADPSVGGMVSANTGGARFLRYGDVRRSLLGLEVVLADGEGTVLDLGTPLWKNNTGLDLKYGRGSSPPHSNPSWRAMTRSSSMSPSIGASGFGRSVMPSPTRCARRGRWSPATSLQRRTWRRSLQCRPL